MDSIELAKIHINNEIGLHHIEPSLKVDFDNLQKAHDAIHEFMYIAALCFSVGNRHKVSWKNKSAFLLYQWEVFNHAHRSSHEALCSYYNVAFILLRTTLELLIKGAFWQCLSYRQFRNESPILDNSSEGKQIKNWLRTVIEASPSIERELEQVSAGIFDQLSEKIENRNFRPQVKTIVEQLNQWGIFSPITDAVHTVYDGLYSGLSTDIHVIPDRIDVGRRIVSEKPDLFEQKVDPAALLKHATILHEIMDIAIVIELNILQDLVDHFKPVRLKLLERLTVMEQLELRYSLMKIRGLLE